MSIYLRNPDARPDTEYETGELRHLVAGNAGRLLDPRRTPVTVVEIRRDIGNFVLRIDDFEDRGALWEVPFEKVDRYQFGHGARRASDAEIETFRATVDRLAQPLVISCSPDLRAETELSLETERGVAADWLSRHGRFLREPGVLPDPKSREGDPALQSDFAEFMDWCGVRDLEDAFADRFVSNPYSGELVKGHRIVIAELGLAPFRGTLVRDPALFDDEWSRRRRRQHIVARLGFIRALFGLLGLSHVRLFRGTSIEGPMIEERDRTFVSTSFSVEVARSHYEAGTPHATRFLAGRMVPIDRVFMTYHETASMNKQFKEAEAVLLYDEEARPF